MNSPDCPYVMHGHVPPPVDDISALEVLQDLSSWVGWGGLSASPTDYTAQEWGARIREGVEWHARAEAQMQKAWCTEALDWREACEDHGIAPDVDSLRAYLETMRDTYTRDTADAMSSEAEQCAEAIRALEVKP